MKRIQTPSLIDVILYLFLNDMIASMFQSRTRLPRGCMVSCRRLRPPGFPFRFLTDNERVNKVKVKREDGKRKGGVQTQ